MLFIHSNKINIFFVQKLKQLSMSDIDDVFESIYSVILSNIQKSLGKKFDWITDSFVDHTISISKYNHFAGSSYVKLPKELNHPKKSFVNIQNINNGVSMV